MVTRKEDGPDATVTPIRRGPPSRKGIPATPKQREALERGHRANKERRARKESEEDGPTRWEQYLAGDLPVTEWDDQELGQMRTKNFHGQFAGRPPNLKPHQIREIKAECQRRGDNLFMRWGPNAIKVTAKIMMDPNERAADRLSAARTFMDRCYGKVPDTVKMAVQAAWEEDIDAVMMVMQDQEEAG